MSFLFLLCIVSRCKCPRFSGTNHRHSGTNALEICSSCRLFSHQCTIVFSIRRRLHDFVYSKTQEFRKYFIAPFSFSYFDVTPQYKFQYEIVSFFKKYCFYLRMKIVQLCVSYTLRLTLSAVLNTNLKGDNTE